MSNDRRLQIFRDRFLGYKQALIDNGLEFDESLVIETWSKVDEGKKATKVLLDMKQPPDAIFSSSDFTALGAIEEIKEHGLKVPDDISIVGFSNEPFTSLTSPSISTINQQSEEMGKMAANALLKRMKQPNQNEAVNIINLKPELIIRESSDKDV